MPWKERSLRWGGGCRMVRDTLQHYESCRATAQANGAKFFAGASGHRACSRLDARQAVATAWQVCLRAPVSRGREAVLEELRTCGELVKGVEPLVREREAGAEPPSRDLMPVRVRVVPPPGRPACDLQRADWLTPYTAQTIAEDALRNGPGARLEVSVPPDLSDAALAGFRDQLAWLDDRDIQVRVRRDRQLRPAAQRRPYAA